MIEVILRQLTEKCQISVQMQFNQDNYDLIKFLIYFKSTIQ